MAGHRHVAVCPSAEGAQVLPKLQVTLEQGSRDPVGRAGRGHGAPLPAAPPASRALTAGPAAEQADAPLLAALRALQLALVAVGGGVRAAHGRHHAGAGALPAHAGGSARAVGAGLTHGAEATQHSSAGCGDREGGHRTRTRCSHTGWASPPTLPSAGRSASPPPRLRKVMKGPTGGPGPAGVHGEPDGKN